MGGLMSNKQMFLVAVALGFVSGFAWVAYTLPLVTGSATPTSIIAD